MKVLIFEDNLFWSARLEKTLYALGHEPTVRSHPDVDPAEFEVAVVNLGSERLTPAALVPALKEKGIYVIGHAGHKETDLREMGKTIGCDRIASNSEMTFHLQGLLEEAAKHRGSVE